GSVVLNVLDGLVVGTASFSFTRQTVDVDLTGDGTVSVAQKDLDDATLLTVGLTNLNLFLGVGGRLDNHNNTNPMDDTLDTTAGVGLQITNGSLALGIIKANPLKIAGDNRSY